MLIYILIGLLVGFKAFTWDVRKHGFESISILAFLVTLILWPIILGASLHKSFIFYEVLWTLGKKNETK